GESVTLATLDGFDGRPLTRRGFRSV
ncbi:MAG: hypothetical protein QOF76_1433, partial [Solirubrobacteraceae bacterium]|nr:hypothetical protein [Solirubrobacteraceae bacterium]